MRIVVDPDISNEHRSQLWDICRRSHPILFLAPDATIESNSWEIIPGEGQPKENVNIELRVLHWVINNRGLTVFYRLER